MGRSVAVLSWADIQMLVKICSHSVPADEERFRELNTLRHSLVESFLIYFREWQPGQVIDDEVRKPLIESLETFSHASPPPKPPFWRRKLEKQDALSFEEMQSECSRIATLLRSAMSPEDHDGDDGDGPNTLFPGPLTALLIYLALQGQWLLQSFARPTPIFE